MCSKCNAKTSGWQQSDQHVDSGCIPIEDCSTGTGVDLKCRCELQAGLSFCKQDACQFHQMPQYGCQPLDKEPRVVCKGHQSAFIACALRVSRKYSPVGSRLHLSQMYTVCLRAYFAVVTMRAALHSKPPVYYIGGLLQLPQASSSAASRSVLQNYLSPRATWLCGAPQLAEKRPWLQDLLACIHIQGLLPRW